MKTIKAWAVLETYPKRIKKPVKPKLAEADIEMGEGCGYPSTSALGVYETEENAKMACKTSKYGSGGAVEIVVPCKITFSLPK